MLEYYYRISFTSKWSQRLGLHNKPILYTKIREVKRKVTCSKLPGCLFSGQCEVSANNDLRTCQKTENILCHLIITVNSVTGIITFVLHPLGLCRSMQLNQCHKHNKHKDASSDWGNSRAPPGKYREITRCSTAYTSCPTKSWTPWLESASELYRPSVRRLSVMLVPTFAERGCHVVNVTDPYGHNLCFLARNRYFFFQVAPRLYSRGWVDFVTGLLLLRESGSYGNRTRTCGYQ
jgi:hypothetical protein